jgi:spermidine/putrescine transport system substrate-binding protein
VIPEFEEWYEEQTGESIKVIYQTFDVNETMLSKIEKGHEDYDVVCPSDYIIERMLNSDLLLPLSFDDLPEGMNYIDQSRSPFIEGVFWSINPEINANLYSVAYMWGTTGILYRDTTLNENKVSYNILFNPQQVKGKFSLLDESRSMLSMALQAKGLNANSVKIEDINEAIDLIREAKRDAHFAGFEGSVSAKDKVLKGEISAAIVFNGEAMSAISEDSTLRYAIPTEGSFMWVDAMTLSSHAQNADGAHAFMNYILDAQNGARLAKSTNFATPNRASIKIIDDKFKQNRVINPTREEIDRMVFLRDPGVAAKLFDDAWEIVKSR